MTSLEELVGILVTKVESLVVKIESLETKVAEQTQEIAELKLAIKKPVLEKGKSSAGNPSGKNVTGTPSAGNNHVSSIDKRKLATAEVGKKQLNETRRNFLKNLVGTGLVTLGASLTAVGTGQNKAQARILVNPVDYPLQFGAITTPPTTTISGQLGDSSVRIGLAACGDPTMNYGNLPLFDTGLYAQGAGYGVYARTDKSMGTGGYFRNVAGAGVGPAYAVSGISDNGTGVYGQGGNSSFGVSGVVNGGGAGVNGNSVSGVGVSGFTSTGVGLRGTADTGIPLRLTPSSSVPISGTRGKGDFYVDTLGRVYVWARNDANSADVWRQISFVPA